MEVFNFCAGPACLPKEVLAEASKAIVDWQQGLSLLEYSHRSNYIKDFVEETEADLRQLLKIPEDYKVLFLQGGARQHFALIPLNFLKTEAYYQIDGIWSDIAVTEAKALGKINIITGSTAGLTADSDAQGDYFYYCDNETINGVEHHQVPKVSIPIVSDMSSNLLTKNINVHDFDLILASAQKNLGTAGLTIVIIKQAFLDTHQRSLPPALNYDAWVKARSMLNTPPVFSWYVTHKMIQWMRKAGGLDYFETMNQTKSQLLYDFIDNSDLYQNSISDSQRSRVNIVFQLVKPELEAAFFELAKANGLYQLKGHRRLGGARASLYNAMPIAGVKALIDFMRIFEKEYYC